MSEFTLLPARLRSGKFVPERGAELVEMDWVKFVERFAPTRSRASLVILRNVRLGMYVGTRTKRGVATTFTFDAAGRSRDARHVIKQDPTFEGSVLEVFLVDKVNWDMRLQELGAA